MTQRTSNSQPDTGRSPKGMPTSAKMGVNVPGIESGIKGTEARPITQTLFDVCHQWKEVGRIALIKGLREFGQDELAAVGNARHHNAGGIAPIVFADLGHVGRDGILSGCRR